jgi:aryl-alcohol dehydrogenase-like predicted oxidoreductase
MVMNVVPSYNADMEYRYLGTTGVRISSLCFGTMSFGGDADLFKSVRDSLKRLGSDYVDIFFLHKFDHRSNLEETLRALEDMRRRGIFRGIEGNVRGLP